MIVNILFARIYSRIMLVLSIHSCPLWPKFGPCWKWKILRVAESYELVEQLWAEFLLTTSCVNIEIYWLSNEVLVGNRMFSVSNTYWLLKITFISGFLFAVTFAVSNVPLGLAVSCGLGEVVWSVQCGVRGGLGSRSCFRSDVGPGYVPCVMQLQRRG